MTPLDGVLVFTPIPGGFSTRGHFCVPPKGRSRHMANTSRPTGNVKDKMESLGSSVSQAASDAKSKVEETASTLSQKAQDTASHLAGKAQDLASTAVTKAQDTASSMA